MNDDQQLANAARRLVARERKRIAAQLNRFDYPELAADAAILAGDSRYQEFSDQVLLAPVSLRVAA